MSLVPVDSGAPDGHGRALSLEGEPRCADTLNAILESSCTFVPPGFQVLETEGSITIGGGRSDLLSGERRRGQPPDRGCLAAAARRRRLQGPRSPPKSRPSTSARSRSISRMKAPSRPLRTSAISSVPSTLARLIGRMPPPVTTPRPVSPIRLWVVEREPDRKIYLHQIGKKNKTIKGILRLPFP